MDSSLSRLPTRKFTSSSRDCKIRSLAWSTDGKRVASGSSDKILRLFNPDKGSNGTEMVGHKGDVTRVNWNPNHPELLVSCSASTGSHLDRGVYFWDIRVSKPTAIIETNGENINMAFSPDGTHLLISNRKDQLTWIDCGEQKITQTSQLKREINEFCFSPNSDLLLLCLDSAIQINNFPSNAPVHTVNVSPVALMTLDLDPRGRYLAVGSNDSTVTLWETENWTCLKSLAHFDGALRSVAFSSDGSYLASGSEDPFISINAVPSGKQVHKIETSNSVAALAWHPSKFLLAYAVEDSTGTFKILG